MFCARSKLRKFSQLDTDDKWFNNPQYRIKVSKRTTVIISLMQEDKRYVDAKNKFVSTNFRQHRGDRFLGGLQVVFCSTPLRIGQFASGSFPTVCSQQKCDKQRQDKK